MNSKSNIPVFYSTLAAISLLLTACSNPADNVNEAEVSSAKEESTTPVEGKQFMATAESKIEFIGSKVTGNHGGGFEKFTAKLVVRDGQLVPNGTSVEIDMDSTWSDSDRLTGHLKNAVFIFLFGQHGEG